MAKRKLTQSEQDRLMEAGVPHALASGDFSVHRDSTVPADGEQVLAWWASPLSDLPSPAHCVGGVWRRWSLIKQAWETPGPPDLWVSLREAKAARAMADALRKIEYVYQDNPVGKCPWCGGKSSRGHKDDCERQAALRAGGGQ